jgi:hypothetical protein
MAKNGQAVTADMFEEPATIAEALHMAETLSAAATEIAERSTSIGSTSRSSARRRRSTAGKTRRL